MSLGRVNEWWQALQPWQAVHEQISRCEVIGWGGVRQSLEACHVQACLSGLK